MLYGGDVLNTDTDQYTFFENVLLYFEIYQAMRHGFLLVFYTGEHLQRLMSFNLYTVIIFIR